MDVEEKNNTTSFIEENEISSLVDYHTYLSSTLNDVNDSISKLRIRYDNTALVVRITTGYDYINCFINPKKDNLTSCLFKYTIQYTYNIINRIISNSN